MSNLITALQSLLFQNSMPGSNSNGASSSPLTPVPSLAPPPALTTPSHADVEAARRKLLEIINGGPQMQDPVKPIMPAYRTEDAIKGGLGLLLSAALGGNQGAAGFAQAYTGQKQNLANQKTQFEQQKVDTANAEAMRKYNQMLTSAQTELGFKNEDYQQAFSEFDRARQKQEQKPPQADEKTVLADARALAGMGGDAREYVLNYVRRSELSLEAAKRILGVIDGEAYKSRYGTRSKAFQANDAAYKALGARHSAQGVGAALGGLALGLPQAKPVSKEEMLIEIKKWQDLRDQINKDMADWRTWNGLADGQKDPKLESYANLLGEIGKRVNELLRMVGPLPLPGPRR